MAKKAKTPAKPRVFANEDEFILFDDYERKKRFVPTAPAMANVMSKLMSQRGYAQIQTTTLERELWEKIAGLRIAAHTRPGKIRGSAWEIFVRNSVLLQELSFAHSQLVKKLQQECPETKVKSLKFKVGPVE
jgi:predicted nucleic acid-binding Zn ribbon protein